MYVLEWLEISSLVSWPYIVTRYMLPLSILVMLMMLAVEYLHPGWFVRSYNSPSKLFISDAIAEKL